MLDIYKNRLNGLTEALNKQYAQLLNAGVANKGDIQNNIDWLEGQVDALQKKITAIEEKAQPVASPPLLIYVITGINDRVKTALDNDDLYTLYASLQPPSHDDNEISKWKPFSKENSCIRDMINQLRKDGYRFEVYYVDGYKCIEYCPESDQSVEERDAEEVVIAERIDDNITNIIAIVDLVAMDDENIKIAGRFNTQRALRVITPICPYLPDQLKLYLTNKRKQVFDLLEYKMNKDQFNVYKPAAYEGPALLQELRTVIKKEKPIFNTIANKNSPEDDKRRLLGPNF